MYSCIYMLLRSFEPPNLTFPASMLSIRIASMLLQSASKLRTTQSSIPGQYAIYTYCQYTIYMLLRSVELLNPTFPASMLSIRIASMLFTCCFEPPNLTFLANMLSIRIASVLFTCCFEASKLRTSQSSIPGQYAIYTYCQYAMYMLVRSFELPNLPFLASMLSTRIASKLCTC